MHHFPWFCFADAKTDVALVDQSGGYGFCFYILAFFSFLLIIFLFPFSLIWSVKVSAQCVLRVVLLCWELRGIGCLWLKSSSLADCEGVRESCDPEAGEAGVKQGKGTRYVLFLLITVWPCPSLPLSPLPSPTPGLFFILPCIDDVRVIDLRTVTFDVPPQEVCACCRRDSNVVVIDAVLIDTWCRNTDGRLLLLLYMYMYIYIHVQIFSSLCASVM